MRVEAPNKYQKTKLKANLYEDFRLHWSRKVWTAGSKGKSYQYYRLFKKGFREEKYLTDLNGYNRINVLKFRIGDMYVAEGDNCPFCNKTNNTIATSPIHFTQCSFFSNHQTQTNIPCTIKEIRNQLEKITNNMLLFINIVTKIAFD